MKLFYRFRDLKRAGVVDSAATLDAWMKAGLFPQPLRLSPGRNRLWARDDLERWIAERMTAEPSHPPHARARVMLRGIDPPEPAEVESRQRETLALFRRARDRKAI